LSEFVRDEVILGRKRKSAGKLLDGVEAVEQLFQELRCPVGRISGDVIANSPQIIEGAIGNEKAELDRSRSLGTEFIQQRSNRWSRFLHLSRFSLADRFSQGFQHLQLFHLRLISRRVLDNDRRFAVHRQNLRATTVLKPVNVLLRLPPKAVEGVNVVWQNHNRTESLAFIDYISTSLFMSSIPRFPASFDAPIPTPYDLPTLP
jgi:hypothetical protein